jgi:hypothetical protein
MKAEADRYAANVLPIIREAKAGATTLRGWLSYLATARPADAARRSASPPDRSALQEELGSFRWKRPPPYAPGWPAPSIVGMLPPFLPPLPMRNGSNVHRCDQLVASARYFVFRCVLAAAEEACNCRSRPFCSRRSTCPTQAQGDTVEAGRLRK